jgi:hypothetical protein
MYSKPMLKKMSQSHHNRTSQNPLIARERLVSIRDIPHTILKPKKINSVPMCVQCDLKDHDEASDAFKSTPPTSGQH